MNRHLLYGFLFVFKVSQWFRRLGRWWMDLDLLVTFLWPFGSGWQVLTSMMILQRSILPLLQRGKPSFLKGPGDRQAGPGSSFTAFLTRWTIGQQRRSLGADNAFLFCRFHLINFPSFWRRSLVFFLRVSLFDNFLLLLFFMNSFWLLLCSSLLLCSFSFLGQAMRVVALFWRAMANFGVFYICTSFDCCRSNMIPASS